MLNYPKIDAVQLKRRKAVVPFRVAVRNKGDATAKSVTVEVAYPEGYTLTSTGAGLLAKDGNNVFRHELRELIPAADTYTPMPTYDEVVIDADNVADPVLVQTAEGVPHSIWMIAAFPSESEKHMTAVLRVYAENFDLKEKSIEVRLPDIVVSIYIWGEGLRRLPDKVSDFDINQINDLLAAEGIFDEGEEPCCLSGDVVRYQQKYFRGGVAQIIYTNGTVRRALLDGEGDGEIESKFLDLNGDGTIDEKVRWDPPRLCWSGRSPSKSRAPNGFDIPRRIEQSGAFLFG